MTSLSPNKKSFEELLNSLNTTISLVNTMMGDMRDQSTSLIVLKAKLESLTENVEVLSHIVRNDGGQGSVVTRLALLEKIVEDLEENIDCIKNDVHEEVKSIKEMIESDRAHETKEEELRKKYQQEKVMTKLKLVAIIAPGLISLAIILIKMLAGETPTP
jgi:chromosome segregation ATPase